MTAKASPRLNPNLAGLDLPAGEFAARGPIAAGVIRETFTPAVRRRVRSTPDGRRHESTGSRLQPRANWRLRPFVKPSGHEWRLR